jgi:uncharacterized protein YbcI
MITPIPNQPIQTMAMQIADAVNAFQKRSTGHLPRVVTVVLSDDTLVITLHDALTPAEKALAQSADGAEKVQEFHRQLFKSAESELRKEIRRITGVAVREAAVEIETKTGAVVHAFTSGFMVQVFRLESGISDDTWNNSSTQS